MTLNEFLRGPVLKFCHETIGNSLQLSMEICVNKFFEIFKPYKFIADTCSAVTENTITAVFS